MPDRFPHGINLSGIRILQALYQGPSRQTKTKLCLAIGFSPLGGTLTMEMNGIKEGSSSGKGRLGLLALGLVSKEELDVEGVVERCFSITPAGSRFLQEVGYLNKPLPPLRSKQDSTNQRYRKEEG